LVFEVVGEIAVNQGFTACSADDIIYLWTKKYLHSRAVCGRGKNKWIKYLN